MNVKRMAMLVHVAHTGSLSQAAQRLHYTTSAVSQQIALLEKETGHPLVHRTSRGVQLTDAGRIVVRHAERIERILESASREIDDLDALRTGTLRLGTFPSASQSVLPYLLERFRQDAPAVEVTIVSDTREALRQRLESGEIELALLWEYPWDEVLATGDEEIAPFADDPAVLLTPDGHPAASRDEIAGAAIPRTPWVVRDTQVDRELLRRTLGDSRHVPEIAFAGHSYDEMQALVAAGIGLAVVPRSATEILRPGLTAVPLREGPVRRLVFAMRRLRPLSPSASVMNALLRSFADELPDSLRRRAITAGR